MGVVLQMHIEIKSLKFSEEIWSGVRYLNIHLHMDVTETTRMIRSTV